MVELLVAITLSGIVLALIAGLYLFSNKLILKYQDNTALEDQRLLIESALSKELISIEKIDRVGEEEIIYSRYNGSIGSIKVVGDSQLVLNDKTIFPAAFKIDNFTSNYYSRKKVIDNFDSETEYLFDKIKDINGNFMFDPFELKEVSAIELHFILRFKQLGQESRFIFYIRSSIGGFI